MCVYFSFVNKKYSWKKKQTVINNIDKAKVHNSIKVEIYKVAFESKVSWDLTTNSVNETFVKETLLPCVNKMLRKWTGVAPGGTEKMFYLPFNYGGLNLPNIHSIWMKILVSKTLQLPHS